MRKIKLRELAMYIIGSTIVIGIVGVFLPSDNSFGMIVGRAVFMGTLFGVLFYVWDNRRKR